MDHIKIFILFLLQLFVFIFGKECIPSENNPTSIICSDTEHIVTNLTYYLSNFSNITQLSIIHSYLTEMPDIYQSNQLTTLNLDNNHIQLINRNYSNLENLSLTSNHIYILHETNLNYPKLKFLDLSHNPIEHIVETFFSEIQFPQLQILKLTNALTHINPYLIDNRLLSFSSMKYLNEIYMDENNFQAFSCSKNTSNIQWELPLSIQKISLANNRIISIDKNCFSSLLNLTQLDLSNNQLDLQDIKSNKQDLLPSTLRILYLNSMTNDLPCSIFDNLIELEQLHLAHLSSHQLEKCIFKNLIKLKTLNLRYHNLKTFDEQIFRPLLTMNQFDELDITSKSLRCDSCSLRWLIDLMKSQNQTRVTCLDQHDKEILINTLELSLQPCQSSSHIFSTMIITISISISFLLFATLSIYTYHHRKFPFSKFAPVYHMIPLRHYDRIHQNTTEDITDDNVMLVT